MILPDDVKCKACAKVFCCTLCREKHEYKNHSEEVKLKVIAEILCPICQNEPFILQHTLPKDLLQHIVNNHLPLHCKKCSRVYDTETSLLKFSNCVKPSNICKLENNNGSVNSRNENAEKNLLNGEKSSSSTQTSPLLAKNVQQTGEGVLTPISMLNLQWKAKSKLSDGYVSDSISSVRNISSIGNCSKRATDNGKAVKGTLVRSTSTPMQVLVSKPKDNVFDSSGCHVSSIYGSSSESDISPTASAAVQFTPESLGCSKNTDRITGNPSKIKRKGKIIAMASPLRQVMSKSIQRAIAKHGANDCQDNWIKTDSKKILDVIRSVSTSSPLDLRTTPALRRSQSEIIERNSGFTKLSSSNITQRKEILYSSQKLTTTTQSILISSTSNSEDRKVDTVYKTCRSVEVFTTEINEMNIKENCSSYIDSLLITPKIAVIPLKKNISFETPSIPTEVSETTEDEVFYTPNTTPTRGLNASGHAKKIKLNSRENDDSDMNNDFSKCNNNKESRGGRLWSMVTSVIRIPFRCSNQKSVKISTPTPSLIKRCASFAGTQSKPLSEEQSSLKRKRTLTSDGQPSSIRENQSGAPPKRIRKIQGRKPIERMRNI